MTSPDHAGPLDVSVAIDVRLLGVVTVLVAGRPINPGRPQQQLLAASLFATPGRLVTYEHLIDQIWDERPPETVRDLLYHLVLDLRNALKEIDRNVGVVVQRGAGGYIGHVELAQVDLHRFHIHHREAQRLERQKDVVGAAQEYRTALDQWGSADLVQPVEPLAGLSGSWASNLRRNSEADYRNALLGFLKTELQLGRHGPAIPVLQHVTGLYPDDEYATGLEMLALYRANRSSDALASYQRLRTQLSTEHGSDPSREIQQLHTRILQQDTDLDLPATEQWGGATDARQEHSTTAQGDKEQIGTDSSDQGFTPKPATHNLTVKTDRRSGGVYITGGRVKARDIAGRDIRNDRGRETS